MIETDKFSRTGRRVLDMRNPSLPRVSINREELTVIKTPPGSPAPPVGVDNVAAWVYCGVIRKATAADVSADETLVLNQPLISFRYVWAGPEIEYEAMVPHQCPETYE